MKEWMTPDEVARELRVSRTTILRAISAGRLTAYRFGARRQGKKDRRGLSVSRAALNTFIERSVVGAPFKRESRRARYDAPADVIELARKLAAEEGR